METASLLLYKETGEPIMVLVGYTKEEVDKYVKGRSETHGKEIVVFPVNVFINPRS